MCVDISSVVVEEDSMLGYVMPALVMAVLVTFLRGLEGGCDCGGCGEYVDLWLGYVALIQQ